MVKIDGDHNVLRNLEAANTQWTTSMVRITGNSNTLDNLTIHNCYNGDSRDCLGVSISDGDDNVIENSTIYDINGDCVNINDVHLSEQGTIIRNNHLYTTIGPCSENAVDIKYNDPNGRPCQIVDNVIHGFRACPAHCGGSGDPHGEAISVHNQGGGYVIARNTIYDVTTAIGVDDYIPDVTIRDNVIYTLAADDPHATNISGAFFVRARNVEIAGNVVEDAPQSFAFVSPLHDVTIHHNTFTRAGTIHGDELPGYDADYNCWQDSTHTLAGPHDRCPPPEARWYHPVLDWLKAAWAWLRHFADSLFED